MNPFENSNNESPDEPSTFSWMVRVLPAPGQNATSYCRNLSFVIHKPVSFDTSDPHPAAVEYLLGALAADLLLGFQTVARRAGLPVQDLEAAFTGVLRNPLVALGVVGETGEVAFERIRGTVYAYIEGEQEHIAALWQETLRRSPIYNTLKHSVALEIELRQSL